jgi:hypothetical protein
MKLRWRNGDDQLQTAVADIRFFEADHRTLRADRIRAANQALARSERTLLAIGLSRPYRKCETECALHWLQVNNLLSVGL